jgi:hypothetical protein
LPAFAGAINVTDLRRRIGGNSTVSEKEAATETHGLRAKRFKASGAGQPIDNKPEQSARAY